jgi:omega-6 fatty acid desaturase (delta-12 desaturase)
MHHVHHLASRIPYYRLPEVLRDHAEFRSLGRITLLESLRGLRLVLWDENVQRLVSFRHVRAEYPTSWRPPRARRALGWQPDLEPRG